MLESKNCIFSSDKKMIRNILCMCAIDVNSLETELFLQKLE